MNIELIILLILLAVTNVLVLRKYLQYKAKYNYHFKANDSRSADKNQWLSVVARSSSNAIMLMDSNGNFEWCNKGFEELYNYKLDEFVHAYGNNLRNASRNTEVDHAIKKCVSTKKPVSYQAKMTKKDKTVLWSQTTLTPVLDKHDNIMQLIAIETDITNIKNAEIEINQHKEEISAQRDEIRKQRDYLIRQNAQIEEQQKNITASIRYARHIQDAIIPTWKGLSDIFPESFLLSIPKDIISGDFYWYYKRGSDVYIAVADCTGHGVPGGIMSILGITFLNEILKYQTIARMPADVLDTMRHYVIKTLNQTGAPGEAQDGMDIALVKIDLEKHTLVFAGAYMPLYFVQRKKSQNQVLKQESRVYHGPNGQELLQIKGDRMPVGIFSSKAKFTNKHLNYQDGDTIYLLSDGYADQFGGENGKRFYSRKLKRMLLQTNNMNAKSQKDTLHTNFLKWKDGNEQIDDVLILGVSL